MNDLIKINNTDGQLTVSSLQVAEHFGKEHRNVIAAITELEKGVAENSADLFIKTSYQHSQNKQIYKAYNLTRDGFSLLVMGFTGKEALAWKLKYINAFNAMEKALKAQQKQLQQLDTQAKADRAAAMKMNAENRRLKLLLANPEWKSLSPAALETMGIKAIENVSGVNLGNMLPVVEKTYSATEVGAMLGISAMKVGQTANKLGIKNDKYGVTVMDKSRYCSKEMPTFRYNAAGVKAIAKALGVKKYPLN